MTFAELRATLIKLTGVADEDFDADGDLVDFGLDSIQVLNLVEEMQARGIRIELADFVEDRTLNGWWRVIERRLESRS